MGDTNQEVLKHPDNRQEVLKPPDDTASFFSGMSVFLEHMANQQTQMTDHLVAQQTHLVAQQTQMTKDARKPVPKPRQLEGTHPTVTGVKAFLKEIEDHHAGHAGAMQTAKLVNTMRRDPNLPVTHFLNMINSAENEALYHNVRTRVEEGLLVRIWNPADHHQTDGVRLLHAIFQDAITPKDSDVSIRTDHKFANEIKPVQFTENKILMARFKTWKHTAEQVRYKRIFLRTTLLRNLVP
jgi:hypothetical protein